MNRVWSEKVQSSTAKYEVKVKELERISQETKLLRSRLDCWTQRKVELEERYDKVCEERDNFEAQLTGSQRSLIAAQTETSQLHGEVAKLGRKKEVLQQKVDSLCSQNATVMLEKSSLEKRLKSKDIEVLQCRKEVVELRRQLTVKSSDYERYVTTQRLRYKEKSDKIEQEYKAKLESFCRSKKEQYDKDKETWVKVFRTKVETEWKDIVNENSLLKESSKKLEVENKQLQTKISGLQRDLEMMETQKKVDLSKLREEYDGKYRRLSVQYKTDVSRLTKRKDKALEENKILIEKRNELQIDYDHKLQEAEKTIRQQKRDYETLQLELTETRSRLRRLEGECVDYSEEIKTLNSVLTQADEISSTSKSNNRVLRSEINSLKRPFVESSTGVLNGMFESSSWKRTRMSNQQ